MVRARDGLRAHLLPALLVVGVALFTRIYQLGAESLWIDEAITFGRMRLPFPELLADTIKRKHLPTYFLLLKAWAQLGDSEWMLRFPSVVFGTLTALLTYAIGWILHGRVAGLVAGILVAISVGQVHYSQEARMYALLTMATTTALLGLTWLAQNPVLASAFPRLPRRASRTAEAETPSLDKPPRTAEAETPSLDKPPRTAEAEAPSSGKPPRTAEAEAPSLGKPPRTAEGEAPSLGKPPLTRAALAAWATVFSGTTLALFTHNTAVFFVVALNAAAAVVFLAIPGWRKPFTRNWLLCMLGVLAIWSLWLPTLLRQTDDVRAHWHGRPATFEWTTDVLVDTYLFGDRTGATGALALTLVGVALFALRDRKRLFWSTLAFALTGTLAAWAVSHEVAMFYRRLLIWTAPPWFLLIAVGIAGLPRPLAGFVAAALATLLLPSLSGYYTKDTKPRWRPLIQKLSDETDASSVILSARAERFLTYYYERITDPLPARSYQRAKPDDLERYLRNVDQFYVIGQSQEADFKNLEARIRATRRYKAVWTERHQNAVLIKYRVRPTGKRQ